MAICIKVSLEGERTGGMWETKLELLKVKAKSFLFPRLNPTRRGCVIQPVAPCLFKTMNRLCVSLFLLFFSFLCYNATQLWFSFFFPSLFMFPQLQCKTTVVFFFLPLFIFPLLQCNTTVGFFSFPSLFLFHQLQCNTTHYKCIAKCQGYSVIFHGVKYTH